MRFQAYAFARKMRGKLPEHDELIQAIDAVSLTVDGKDFVARAKTLYSGMQAALEAMGGPEGVAYWAGKSKEDRDMEESMHRALAKAASGSDVPDISLGHKDYPRKGD